MTDVCAIDDRANFGGWTIERDSEGGYSLYEPCDLRAAPVYWDSRGQCWVLWEHPQDGEGLVFPGAVYADQLDVVSRLLKAAKKPDDVEPRDPHETEFQTWTAPNTPAGPDVIRRTR